MNQKIQPKVKPRRHFINITIPVNNFIKGEMNSLANITSEKPLLKKVFTDNTSKITDIQISLKGQDYSLNNFKVFEKINMDKDQPSIKEYRYCLIPQLDGDKQYFRFDFQPLKIPLTFPNAHINVNKDIWGKAHLVYPDDTDLDLHKLTMKKAVKVFCHYESKRIHPASDRGITYIPLVNKGEKDETIY